MCQYRYLFFITKFIIGWTLCENWFDRTYSRSWSHINRSKDKKSRTVITWINQSFTVCVRCRYCYKWIKKKVYLVNLLSWYGYEWGYHRRVKIILHGWGRDDEDMMRYLHASLAAGQWVDDDGRCQCNRYFFLFGNQFLDCILLKPFWSYWRWFVLFLA